ncbi:hypothetical protein [Lentzea cavernae]|nr:hypothetical protein [Lentzea cavernae]
MTTEDRAVPREVTRTGPPMPLGPQETIDQLLRGLRRDQVPIRTTFVQKGKGKDTTPGKLAEFVSGRDVRGLDAYLLLHALASSAPWNCDLPSGFWVRCLGLADVATEGPEAIDNARAAVSKIMKRLVDRDLVKRTRVKRRASLTLLCEDGSGEDYTHPFDRNERYLQLPHAYWHDGHFLTLSLAAKVMLLISLERKDKFVLPQKKVPGWYGVSADTADRGFRELREVGLLDVREDWVTNPRSDIGWTQQYVYSLTGEFSAKARSKASAEAEKSYAAQEENA